MQTVTRTSTVLTKARAIVAASWCKGAEKKCTINGKRERYCSIGAVYEVLGAEFNFQRTRDAALDSPFYFGGPNRTLDLIALSGTYDDRLWNSAVDYLNAAARTLGTSSGIIGLNDAPKTTRAKVLEAYDIAIAAAKRDEWRARQQASRNARKLVDA